LLPCLSAFNGFAIYKTAVFLDPGIQYDGCVRLDLVPPQELKMHAGAAKSRLVFQDYGHVKGRYEDCEHRTFHRQGIKKGAKIRITPDILLFFSF
jgi:hypothetical protein